MHIFHGLKLGHSTPALLSLGLTRPVALVEGGGERHWLQVNAIHSRMTRSGRVFALSAGSPVKTVRKLVPEFLYFFN